MYILDAENIKKAKITQGLIIINCVSFIIFNIILPINFILQLVQINSKIVRDNEYYRLFTSMFLHADIMHIFSNMLALLIFGAVVENNFSKLEYFIIYFISGLIGNLFSLILLPLDVISLGASGAIFGLIGASFILVAIDGDRRLLFISLLYLIYFIIASLAPEINLWAHLFGLIGGIFFGYLFSHKRRDQYNYL